MATFIETPRFPDCISEGSTGGPVWATSIVISASGFEHRSSRWKDAKHQYNAAFGIRSMEDMLDLKEFFLAMRGPAYGFRFKDFGDFSTALEFGRTVSAVDMPLGTGDGATTVFQLSKDYEQGFSYTRPITKPVAGTVRVAVDSAAIVEGVGFTVDTTTGLVTFTTAPAQDAVLTAGFEFDVPCRFATDTLDTQYSNYQTGAANVPVVEIRL